MSIKLLFLSLLFAVSALEGSDEIVQIATKQARELEEAIILVDPTATLSPEQRELVIELFTEKIEKTRHILASGGEDVEKKQSDLMEDITKRLHFDILTKAQRKAKFEFQKNYQSK